MKSAPKWPDADILAPAHKSPVIPSLQLPVGTVLYHGTSAEEDFDIPRGPAHFSMEEKVARDYAWQHGSGARPRVLKYIVTTKLSKMVDIPGTNDRNYNDAVWWLEKLLGTKFDGIGYQIMPQAWKHLGDAGFNGLYLHWANHGGDDVLIIRPEKFLSKVDERAVTERNEKMSIWKKLWEALGDDGEDEKPLGANPFEPPARTSARVQQGPQRTQNVKPQLSPPGPPKVPNPPKPSHQQQAKPNYPGTFVGQEWTTNGQVGFKNTRWTDKASGEDRFGKTPSMQKVSMVWDGQDWITKPAFDLKAKTGQLKKKPNEGVWQWARRICEQAYQPDYRAGGFRDRADFIDSLRKISKNTKNYLLDPADRKRIADKIDKVNHGGAMSPLLDELSTAVRKGNAKDTEEAISEILFQEKSDAENLGAGEQSFGGDFEDL